MQTENILIKNKQRLSLRRCFFLLKCSSDSITFLLVVCLIFVKLYNLAQNMENKEHSWKNPCAYMYVKNVQYI